MAENWLFSRGISRDLIEALNDLYEEGDNWWRSLLADKDIFIAVRKNTLNAYYRGCSLAEIALRNGEVVAKTHYKYLLKPDLNKYVSATSGLFDVSRALRDSAFVSSLSDLKSIKSAAAAYAGVEKDFVSEIVCDKANPSIVDVEIALWREETDERKTKQGVDRIDFAALRRTRQGLELVMCEAKHFTNKELRAEGTPHVLGQIDRYEKLLAKYTGQIKESYVLAAEAALKLKGVRTTHSDWAKALTSGNFAISLEPVLVICGFDADQKAGKVWNEHRQKLVDALGKHRVIGRGAAKGLNLLRELGSLPL